MADKKLENMSYERAMELIKKHEGLRVTGYGAKYTIGNSSYNWDVKGLDVFYKNGTKRIRDGREVGEDIYTHVKTGWNFTNAKKVKATKIARRMNKDRIIAENGDYLIVRAN